MGALVAVVVVEVEISFVFVGEKDRKVDHRIILIYSSFFSKCKRRLYKLSYRILKQTKLYYKFLSILICS